MSDKRNAQGVVLRDFEAPESAGGQQAVSQKKAHVKADGEYGVANTEPNSSGVIAHTRDAAVDETHQVERITSVPGEDDKQALDVAISHSDGDNIDEDRPLPVYLAQDPGEEFESYDNAVNLDKDAGATANHDHTVTALKEFKRLVVKCRSTNEAYFQLQIEDGVAAGTFTTVGVGFTTGAKNDDEISYNKTVGAGIIIRVVKTNYHNQDNDIHSQIQGIEVLA